MDQVQHIAPPFGGQRSLDLQHASDFQAALHADLLALAQPRRAPVCRDHAPAHPARRLQERCRSGGRNPSLDRRAQQQAEALQVDSKGRYHPRQERPRPCRSAVHGRGYQMNESQHQSSVV